MTFGYLPRSYLGAGLLINRRRSSRRIASLEEREEKALGAAAWARLRFSRTPIFAAYGIAPIFSPPRHTGCHPHPIVDGLVCSSRRCCYVVTGLMTPPILTSALKRAPSRIIRASSPERTP